jgi:hypothetical protein
MELLERYLQAVREYLLRNSRRDDIVKELGGNILSQMEDKAAELGRPLSQAEQAAILKQHGHPLLAAARYRRLPMQQLIGPALFPLYWYMLQALVVIVAAFNVVLVVVLAFGRGSILQGVVSAWGFFWLCLLVAVGGLTIGFGLIEYFGGGKVPFTGTFDPLELPAVKKLAPPRGNSMAELVLGSMFLAGWPLFLHLPAPAFAGTLPVRLAPAWWHFEAPMLLAVALGMAASFVSLFRPQYPRLRAALRLASSVAGVATFYLFLLTGEFVVANPSAAARLNDPVHIGDHVFTAGQLANYGAAAAPLIALVVFFCDGLVEVTRLLRARRQPRIVTQEWNGIF